MPRGSLAMLMMAQDEVLEGINIGSEARSLVVQHISCFEPDGDPSFTSRPRAVFVKPFCRPFRQRRQDERSVMMMALPFFCVRKDKDPTLIRLGSSETAPTRTLLQMLFPSMSNIQKGQQALHNVDDFSGYLHVSQLWAIVLNGAHEGMSSQCRLSLHVRLGVDAEETQTFLSRARNSLENNYRATW